MQVDWSVRGLRTRMNVQRRRRCTFILSPVLSRRDKTLETRHPPTADPVMNVQLRPERQEGADGRPAVPCRRGAQGWLQRVLVAGTPTALVAGGCEGGAAVSDHPGERVLTRVRAGGGSRSTGPYGAGRSRSHTMA